MKSWALLSSKTSNLPMSSMTRGKLLDNDTQLFIFISILIMTQLHPRDPENNGPDSRNGASRKNRLQPVEWESVVWLTAVMTYREIMPSSCPLTYYRGKESSHIRMANLFATEL